MPPRMRSSHLPSSISTVQVSKSYLCSQCLHQLQQRQFSTGLRHGTRQRGDLFRWLSGPGAVFRQALPGSTNYINAYDRSGNLIRAKYAQLPGRQEDENKKPEEEEETSEYGNMGKTRGDNKPTRSKAAEMGIPKETAEDLVPFPMNRQFRSQAVLSEELKEEIWRRVTVELKTVRDVSATLGVEMRRIGAVVRLKAIEKQWEKEGKPLATPYAKAITAMLPQTPYIPHDPVTHESINDLPVHRATTLQMFHPVSESRHFTRTDAGKVFNRSLLPAEDRIPHTELYLQERWRNEGVIQPERVRRRKEMNQQELENKKKMERLNRERGMLTVKKAETPRWEFRFKDINVEIVGKDRRDRRGVGARYGMPHEDRKKGQVKIPTRVV